VKRRAAAFALAVCAGASVAGWTSRAGADETTSARDAPPAADDAELMRYPPTSVRAGLIGGGLGVIGLAYGVGALSASSWPEVPGSDWLYVPVIGPWAALATGGCAADDPGCGAILVMRGILYSVSGLAQLGGLGLIGEGALMTTESSDSPVGSLTVLPMAGPQAAGLTVLGVF